jgi:hypothetical protein
MTVTPNLYALYAEPVRGRRTGSGETCTVCGCTPGFTPVGGNPRTVQVSTLYSSRPAGCIRLARAYRFPRTGFARRVHP